jgi:hypothetical protein
MEGKIKKIKGGLYIKNKIITVIAVFSSIAELAGSS